MEIAEKIDIPERFKYNKAGKRVKRNRFKRNSCTKKIRIESLELARKKRARIWYEYGHLQGIYHCRFCDGFHLTRHTGPGYW